MDHVRACVENPAPESEPAEQEEFPSFAQHSTTDPVNPSPVSETPEAIGIAGSGTVSCRYAVLCNRRENGLVTFARYSWTLLECWQSQSDCSATNYDICITVFVTVIGCAALRV